MTTAGQHGQRGTYVKGCRCDQCRASNTEYARMRSRRVAYATFDQSLATLLDSAPVRAHLAQLRAAGLGRRTIADKSGVAQTVIDRLLGLSRSRPARRVRPDTERRILSVTVEDLANSAVVDGTGTARRLQALVAIGWTQHELARRIGWTPANLCSLMHARRPVTAATARRVAGLYDELSMTPASSSRARSTARRNGWVPPLAWDDDDIDDPSFAPAADAIRSDAERTHIEDILELDARGITLAAIAARVGLAEATVKERLREARKAAS